MGEQINITLSADEVIMIQELTEDTEVGYTWMRKIVESLREKALEAYKKPVISTHEAEYRANIAYDDWMEYAGQDNGKDLAFQMKRAEEVRLRFHYEIKEDQDEENTEKGSTKETGREASNR